MGAVLFYLVGSAEDEYKEAGTLYSMKLSSELQMVLLFHILTKPQYSGKFMSRKTYLKDTKS